jgi:hypothetical protein
LADTPQTKRKSASFDMGGAMPAREAIVQPAPKLSVVALSLLGSHGMLPLAGILETAASLLLPGGFPGQACGALCDGGKVPFDGRLCVVAHLLGPRS